MKTFFQWANDNQIELPEIVEPKATTNENGFRTGDSANYPPLYSPNRANPLYGAAVKATNALDQQNIKSKNIKKPKDTAAN